MKDAYGDREIYRTWVRSPDLRLFRVSIRETDLLVSATSDLSKDAWESTLRHRLSLEEYIRQHQEFGASFVPLPAAPDQPKVVARMITAAAAAGVGPMAAVAGAMAECVGEDLLTLSETVIVENGGDLFLASPQQRIVGIYAGAGPAEFSLGLRFASAVPPLGVATSSATIGPSYSAGRARAATVVAMSASLADAWATALGNRLRQRTDLKPALESMGGIPGVIGAVAVIGDSFAACGALDLVQLPTGDDRS